MSNNIEGKVVVAAGASSGLGEAAASLLSQKGATVVLGARRSERIQALADEINEKRGKARAANTDVADVRQVRERGDAAVEGYASVDVNEIPFRPTGQEL